MGLPSPNLVFKSWLFKKLSFPPYLSRRRGALCVDEVGLCIMAILLQQQSVEVVFMAILVALLTQREIIVWVTSATFAPFFLGFLALGDPLWICTLLCAEDG